MGQGLGVRILRLFKLLLCSSLLLFGLLECLLYLPDDPLTLTYLDLLLINHLLLLSQLLLSLSYLTLKLSNAVFKGSLELALGLLGGGSRVLQGDSRLG